MTFSLCHAWQSSQKKVSPPATELSFPTTYGVVKDMQQ